MYHFAIKVPSKSVLVIHRQNSLRHYFKQQRILNILEDMPKLEDTQDIYHNKNYYKTRREAQKKARNNYESRRENQKKFQISHTVRLEVIGSGAIGAPRSVHLFTNSYRYLFNCGEGTQRLASEYKIKLSRLQNVFITYPSWENMSGLLGVALTLQNIGIPELHIHGPENVEKIFSATNKFVSLRFLSILKEKCNPENDFFDGVLNVKYVQLYPPSYNPVNKNFSDATLKTQEANEVSSEEDYSHEEDNEDIDYYAHLYTKHERQAIIKKVGEKSKKRKRASSEVCKRQKSEPKFALSYICRTSDTAGSLLAEKCIELGVPPGPLLGKLKSGEDVCLENGTVVKSKDVMTEGTPGAVLIFVECPTEDYLDSLLKEPAFFRHQLNENNPDEEATVVVHFTNSAIVNTPKYKEWIHRFSERTKHVLINDDNQCLGSVAVHRLQYKLNMIHPDIFPPLPNSGIPHYSDENNAENVDSNKNKTVYEIDEEDESENKTTKHFSYYKCDSNFIKGKTLCKIYVRPIKNDYDYSNCLVLKEDYFLKEVLENEGMEEELENFKKELMQMEPQIQAEKRIYPKILFLGTGSSQPSKVRNPSSILVFVNEKSCMMLDCGEASYGQIVRFFGLQKSKEILRSLHTIYISHLHADHHMGLISLLKNRKAAFDELQSSDDKEAAKNIEFKPVFLCAPIQLLRWLYLFNSEFENISNLYSIIPNDGLLIHNDGKPSSENYNDCLECLDLKEIKTTLVDHCPNSYGVAIVHNDGWKLTYSGDTRPCKNLVNLGKNSDILIHEATMDHNLSKQAHMKLHSTTTQAIKIGKQMKAKYILLTHFSQRYSYLPLFCNAFTPEVGIAFDNMIVSYNQLPLLSKLLKVMKVMFSDKYTMLEERQALLEQKSQLRKSVSPDFSPTSPKSKKVDSVS